MERPAAPDVHKAQVTACVRVRPRAPARAASRAVRDDGAGPAWLARLLAAPAVTQVTIEATGAEQVVHRVDQRRHQGGRGERAAPRCSRWVARESAASWRSCRTRTEVIAVPAASPPRQVRGLRRRPAPLVLYAQRRPWRLGDRGRRALGGGRGRWAPVGLARRGRAALSTTSW